MNRGSRGRNGRDGGCSLATADLAQGRRLAELQVAAGVLLAGGGAVRPLAGDRGAVSGTPLRRRGEKLGKMKMRALGRGFGGSL